MGGAVDDAEHTFRVARGDPRPALQAAAAHLEDLGHTDFAEILQKLTQQYNNFYDEIKRITPEEWYPPPGILSPPAPSSFIIGLGNAQYFEDGIVTSFYDSVDDLTTTPPPPVPAPNLTRKYGATWDLSVVGRVAGVDPDTGLHRTQGDYARVADLAEAGGASYAVPADTRAVVDTMPTDFKQWEEMNKNLAAQHTQHRRSSNWRATLAYGDAIKDVRKDLLEGLKEFGGGAQDLAATSDTADIYRALQNLLAQADEAGDTDTVRAHPSIPRSAGPEDVRDDGGSREPGGRVRGDVGPRPR